MRSLVIGVGNVRRGDDGAGPAVAEVVERRVPQVRTVVVQQLVPELADELSRVDQAIFVDASAAVDRVAVRDVAPHAGSGCSHVFSPAELVALCHDAYGVTPARVWQIEVPASRFDLGEGFSAATRRGVDEAARRVVELIGD